ncbi:MAG: metal ABC transporter ATP-binding protein [Deinococcales bacterium]
MLDAARFPTDHTSRLLEVRDLAVNYGEITALEGTNFHLCPREFVAIIGPNGAGKSTLLKAILGLVPFRGQVEFSKTLHPKPNQHIAYVPQTRALDWAFPVTVWDVVMMARTRRIGWLRSPTAQDRKIVADALGRAGLFELRDRPIGQLSGGQRQRALLARMIAREASLLFLDEPFNGVDTTSQEQILELLESERQCGKGILMVTHDLEAARNWCSHILLVNQTVIASGEPEKVYTPENIARTFSRGVA